MAFWDFFGTPTMTESREKKNKYTIMLRKKKGGRERESSKAEEDEDIRPSKYVKQLSFRHPADMQVIIKRTAG